MKIFVITFGCKVNQYDSSQIESACISKGMEIVEDPAAADVCVVSTCAVTAESERQARQKISNLHRINPSAKIIVMGCASELESRRWDCLDGVDFVCGVSDRKRLEKYFGIDLFSNEVVQQDRARYFLKVQDGCDHCCAYCAIRIARGKSRSFDKKWVLDQYKRISDLGVKEIVLTGIHLGDYGKDLGFGKKALSDLIRLLLKENGPRIRLSSLHPNELGDDLLGLLKDERKLCRHVHLSVQSMSDEILKRMNRQYQSRCVMDTIEKLNRSVEGIFISCDVIAGFPGECEKEFETTRTALVGLPISSLHVFPYSKREGTPASEFLGQVEKSVKKERAAILRRVAQEKLNFFLNSQIGRSFQAIVTDVKEDFVEAMTDNYMTVHLSPKISYGKMGTILIKSLQKNGVVGEWI